MINKVVSDRVTELGLDQTITPFVLEELKKIQESKAIGSVKGKPDLKKQAAIAAAHSGKRFVSSLRAHARQARKKLDKLVASFERDVITLVKQYNTRARTPILNDDGKPSGKFKIGNRTIGFPKLKTRSTLMLKGSTESAFQLGTKAAGIVKANGSPYDLTKQEKKWLTSYLKEEVSYWYKFLDAVRSGQSDKKTLQRIKRFAEGIRSAFESGRVLSVGPDVIIHWVLESGDPCPDCRTLHRYSPYTSETLPTTPKAGQTRCRTYCYCTLRIVKSDPKEVAKVRKRVKKPIWVLNQIKRAQKKRK